MVLINTDRMSFIGPVSEWFWTAPVPPVTPIGMGKDSRGVDLESVDDLDERQITSWMERATAIPGFARKKR